SAGLTPGERQGLERLSERAVGAGTVLRLRVRDLEGRVVFSGDGSGLSGGAPDEEAVEAAGGTPVTRLTRLNRDSNDAGPEGVAAVEAYRVLRAGPPGRRPRGLPPLQPDPARHRSRAAGAAAQRLRRARRPLPRPSRHLPVGRPGTAAGVGPQRLPGPARHADRPPQPHPLPPGGGGGGGLGPKLE